MSTEPVTSATGIPARTDPSEQVVGLLAAQVHVEKHDVRALRRDRRLRLGDGGRFPHREALELEVHAAEHAQRRIVVDDERPGQGLPASAAECSGSIGIVAPRTGTQERYAVQVGELWSWLSPTLTRVEEPARRPVATAPPVRAARRERACLRAGAAGGRRLGARRARGRARVRAGRDGGASLAEGATARLL